MNQWCFWPQFYTPRLLGRWQYGLMSKESCHWCSIDRSTCWPCPAPYHCTTDDPFYWMWMTPCNLIKSHLLETRVLVALQAVKHIKPITTSSSIEKIKIFSFTVICIYICLFLCLTTFKATSVHGLRLSTYLSVCLSPYSVSFNPDWNLHKQFVYHAKINKITVLILEHWQLQILIMLNHYVNNTYIPAATDISGKGLKLLLGV